MRTPHFLPSPLGDSPIRGNVRKDKRVCVSAEGKVGDVSRSDEVFQPNLNDCLRQSIHDGYAVNSRTLSAFNSLPYGIRAPLGAYRFAVRQNIASNRTYRAARHIASRQDISLRYIVTDCLRLNSKKVGVFGKMLVQNQRKKRALFFLGRFAENVFSHKSGKLLRVQPFKQRKLIVTTAEYNEV